MSFKGRLDFYRKAKQDRIDGRFDFIPFDLFPRFREYLPGIIRGTNYLVSGATSAGKSSLARYMFIVQVYDFVKKHPNVLKPIIFLNALEETVEETKDILVCQRIYSKYGITITVNDLNGYSTNLLTDEVLAYIEEEMVYFEDLESILVIYDIPSWYGFYKKIRQWAYQNGTFYREDNPISVKDDNWKNIIFDSYKSNDPKLFPIVFSDHIGLYAAGNKTKYQMLADWSRLCRMTLNKKLGMAVVNVQQLASSSDAKQFSFRGENIAGKLEPSIDKLGDNKGIAQDHLVVLAIFDPSRYGLLEYEGYDLEKMGDRCKFLFILKNRKGRKGLKLPLYFDGAANFFKELPNPYDSESMEKVYKLINI